MEPITVTAALVASIKAATDIIEKGINERASAPVLREHLLLAKDRLAFISEQTVIVMDKVSKLEQEKSALEKHLAELEAELKPYRQTKQFTEHRGALFERKAEGGYSLTPRCPNCHKHMSSVFDMPYNCACGYAVDFDSGDLPCIKEQLSEL